jgi:hypothetical protein
MKPARKKTTSLPLRTWRVGIIRRRGAFLGDVQAPDRETAEAAAVEKFKLNDEQRKRLILQERRLTSR